MATVPPITRLALYARVSTEEQAERQTIDAQLIELRKYADLYDLPIAGVYIDDGVSGTIPLEDRPEGRRMLADAASGAFNAVAVTRLDRFARKLKVLLTGAETLTAHGIAIRSVAEMFDTATPWGKAMFHFLGVLAELDRDNLLEKFSAGRDRVARDGKYTGGPIPTGYELDAAGKYIPSTVFVPELGITEAELIAQIYERIAFGGSSFNAEATRLTALKVRRVYRYAKHAKTGKQTVVEKAAWTLTAIAKIVHNEDYKGVGGLDSKRGAISFAMPALVDADTWERAQVATQRNRKFSSRNAKRTYHLRGLIKCGSCGLGYVGATSRLGRVYRCHAQTTKATIRQEPCPGGIIDANKAEALAWNAVLEFVRNPGPYVERAEQQLAERRERVAATANEAGRLAADLTAKEAERQNVIRMARKGLINEADQEQQMAEIAAEEATLQKLLGGIRVQQQLVIAHAEYVAGTLAALERYREQADEIERTNDWTSKREMLENLMPKLEVRTTVTGLTPGGRRRKETRLWAQVAFKPAVAIDFPRLTAGKDCYVPDELLAVVMIERALLPSA